MNTNLNQVFLLRPLNHALVKRTRKHLRKDGKNIDLHRRHRLSDIITRRAHSGRETITKTYDKLVRDKIPQRLKKKGLVAVTRIAEENEYWQKLKAKLVEEVREFLKEEKKEEIVDLLEVIEAICVYKKFDKRELAGRKSEKARQRGKFRKRIILEKIG